MDQLNETTENLSLAEKKNAANELQWEQNHADIANFIIDHLKQHGTMPGKVLVAQGTGLSRETVYKHLRTFNDPAHMQFIADGFGLVAAQVTGAVGNLALTGNLKAAKLFLQTVSALYPNSQKQEAVQNSYVQINKTIINQQVIQQLKPEQLNRIEQIIAKEIAEKEI